MFKIEHKNYIIIFLLKQVNNFIGVMNLKNEL